VSQENVASLPVRKPASWDYQVEVGGVVIATPCYGGTVTSAYCGALAATLAMLERRGVRAAWHRTDSESLIQRARNRLAAQFLAWEEATHFIFIDADIGWKPDDIWRLIAHDVPVIGGIYPKKTIPLEFPCHTVCDDNGVARKDRIEIAHAPTGFLCIKREVFTTLMKAYPESKITAMQSIGDDVLPWLYDFFWTGVADGIHWSEDYGFCRRWRAIGGEVWMDPAIKLTHMGMHAFEGDPWTMFERPAAEAAA
jgi:hypothetical protein